MAEVQITDAEHAKIVFKFETEETVYAVAAEVAKAEEAGEFAKAEPKKAAK